MQPILAWLQDSALAHAVGHSTPLIALLSGLHLMGMTIVVGGALISGLRLTGLLLRERPVAEIARSAARGMEIGLALSLASGFLLFIPRTESAAGIGIFQIKMSLLATALLFHFLWYRRLVAGKQGGTAEKIGGAMALALWFAIAVCGSLFILLE